ncbi:hypothetical protein ACFPJ1_40705 [Kribbella qitaiheensis]|uniref:hypothetical protein n=1 Tax=Kribbella qitaiheensis TaxID=1544730 RepID=UPI00361A34DB
MTPLPTVTPVADATYALLQAIEHLNVYDTELPTDPPLDPDGRVHPYAVFFPSGGNAFGDRLNDAPTELRWGCRILFVGGDKTRALWALDKIRAALTGKRPTGGARLKEVLDDVTIRTETDVVPSRTSGSILYRLHV